MNVRYPYDESIECTTLTLCERQEEEGEYEYASHQQHGESGNEQAHIEPAVLYQPLGEVADADGFDEEWRRIFIEYGSRCEQYGGHWQGHRCVGSGIVVEVMRETRVELLLALQRPLLQRQAPAAGFCGELDSARVSSTRYLVLISRWSNKWRHK
jgi:hypothetical protein